MGVVCGMACLKQRAGLQYEESWSSKLGGHYRRVVPHPGAMGGLLGTEPEPTATVGGAAPHWPTALPPGVRHALQVMGQKVRVTRYEQEHALGESARGRTCVCVLRSRPSRAM